MHRERAIALVDQAYQTLGNLLGNDKASPSLQFKAAKFIIEQATPPIPSERKPRRTAAKPAPVGAGRDSLTRHSGNSVLRDGGLCPKREFRAFYPCSPGPGRIGGLEPGWRRDVIRRSSRVIVLFPHPKPKPLWLSGRKERSQRSIFGVGTEPSAPESRIWSVSRQAVPRSRPAQPSPNSKRGCYRGRG